MTRYKIVCSCGEDITDFYFTDRISAEEEVKKCDDWFGADKYLHHVTIIEKEEQS